MARLQVNFNLTQEVYDRLPIVLEKAREQLGTPNLSMADFFSMGMQVLEQWLDRAEEMRPAILDQIEQPTPPPKKRRSRKPPAEAP